MTCNVLVVEDEVLLAIEIESALAAMGHRPVGVADDARRALELAPAADVALVDINLVDGPTGIEIGRVLADRGVTVMYMSADPAQVRDGVPGTVGILPKPIAGSELREAVRFAVARHPHDGAVPPPRSLKLFDSDAELA